jgi:hypothetical protein
VNTTNGTTSSASATPVGSGAALEITENGPIKVSGPVKIVRRRSIRNARGAGIAWGHVVRYPTTKRRGYVGVVSPLTNLSAMEAIGKVLLQMTHVRSCMTKAPALSEALEW